MVVKEKDWHADWSIYVKWYKILNADLLLAEVIPFTTDYVSDTSAIAAWSTSKVEPSEPWKIWKFCKF